LKADDSLNRSICRSGGKLWAVDLARICAPVCEPSQTAKDAPQRGSAKPLIFIYLSRCSHLKNGASNRLFLRDIFATAAT
jgi:hypothetical protein